MTSQEQEHVGTGGEKSKKYDRQLRYICLIPSLLVEIEVDYCNVNMVKQGTYPGRRYGDASHAVAR